MRRMACAPLLGLLWSLAFAGLVNALDHVRGARPDALIGWLIYHLGGYWAGLIQLLGIHREVRPDHALAGQIERKAAGEEVGEHITRRPFDVVAGFRCWWMGRPSGCHTAGATLYLAMT